MKTKKKPLIPIFRIFLTLICLTASTKSFPQNPPKGQTINLPYEQAIELTKLAKKSTIFAKQNDALIKENTHLKKTQLTIVVELNKKGQELKVAHAEINKYEKWVKYAVITIIVIVALFLVKIFRG